MTTQTISTKPRALPGLGLHSLLRRGLHQIAVWRMERAIRRSLAALDDHLLRDIGLRRDQIEDFAGTSARASSPEGRLLSALFL